MTPSQAFLSPSWLIALEGRLRRGVTAGGTRRFENGWNRWFVLVGRFVLGAGSRFRRGRRGISAMLTGAGSGCTPGLSIGIRLIARRVVTGRRPEGRR